MNVLLYSLLILLLLLGLHSCTADKLEMESVIQSGMLKNKMKGMTLVVAQSPIGNTPIQKLDAIGVDWVALTPYRFYESGVPAIDTVSCCPAPDCPFGVDTKHGVIEAIEAAQSMGLKIMLKPQLWSNSEWVGELSFNNEMDWITFGKAYMDYIDYWVTIAEDMNVEMFCIGTELREFVAQRPQYWDGLIATIRQSYSGKLTYAANWDDYMAVTFWDDLDYIGVDAYFPLINDKTPKVSDLKNAWVPYLYNLEFINNQYNKPVLFTEFGYLSMNTAAYNTWELENQKSTVDINEEAQANALQALLEVFAPKEWWQGGFQWKWYADTLSANCEEDLTKDYTPEGKMAEGVLKIMYN